MIVVAASRYCGGKVFAAFPVWLGIPAVFKLVHITSWITEHRMAQRSTTKEATPRSRHKTPKLVLYQPRDHRYQRRPSPSPRRRPRLSYRVRVQVGRHWRPGFFYRRTGPARHNRGMVNKSGQTEVPRTGRANRRPPISARARGHTGGSLPVSNLRPPWQRKRELAIDGGGHGERCCRHPCAMGGPHGGVSSILRVKDGQTRRGIRPWR
ncbi:hypothetical protein B0H13DRAFT_424818 [Mycena leptocephala]|nr:hypothetical protein B0H13DRAFT_424818 [Mycena leptocephala]